MTGAPAASSVSKSLASCLCKVSHAVHPAGGYRIGASRAGSYSAADSHDGITAACSFVDGDGRLDVRNHPPPHTRCRVIGVLFAGVLVARAIPTKRQSQSISHSRRESLACQSDRLHFSFGHLNRFLCVRVLLGLGGNTYDSPAPQQTRTRLNFVQHFSRVVAP